MSRASSFRAASFDRALKMISCIHIFSWRIHDDLIKSGFRRIYWAAGLTGTWLVTGASIERRLESIAWTPYGREFAIDGALWHDFEIFLSGFYESGLACRAGPQGEKCLKG
jgi:hypothetical protein